MNVLVYVVAWTGTCMHALKYLKEVIQSYSRTVARIEPRASLC